MTVANVSGLATSMNDIETCLEAEIIKSISVCKKIEINGQSNLLYAMNCHSSTLMPDVSF